MGLAHVVGAGARALSPDKIAKEDRRDGLPFFLFILGLAGAFFTWFLAKDATAMGLNVVTFGLLFGRVSYALPVVLVISEIFGVHEYIADVTRRLAQAGYMAIAPELFVRQGDAQGYGEMAKLIAEVIS